MNTAAPFLSGRAGGGCGTGHGGVTGATRSTQSVFSYCFAHRPVLPGLHFLRVHLFGLLDALILTASPVFTLGQPQWGGDECGVGHSLSRKKGDSFLLPQNMGISWGSDKKKKKCTGTHTPNTIPMIKTMMLFRAMEPKGQNGEQTRHGSMFRRRGKPAKHISSQRILNSRHLSCCTFSFTSVWYLKCSCPEALFPLQM